MNWTHVVAMSYDVFGLQIAGRHEVRYHIYVMFFVILKKK